jgi:hypothetical protein
MNALNRWIGPTQGNVVVPEGTKVTEDDMEAMAVLKSALKELTKKDDSFSIAFVDKVAARYEVLLSRREAARKPALSHAGRHHRSYSSSSNSSSGGGLGAGSSHGNSSGGSGAAGGIGVASSRSGELCDEKKPEESPLPRLPECPILDYRPVRRLFSPAPVRPRVVADAGAAPCR